MITLSQIHEREFNYKSQSPSADGGNPHLTMDAVIPLLTIVATTAATHLMLAEAATDEISELRLLLLPLIGSLIMSGGTILLNPHKDTRQIVIGRSIIALLMGSALPAGLGILFNDTLGFMTKHPVLMLLAGSLISAGTYILSKPLFAKAYERAERNADKLLTKVEKRLGIDEP